MYCPGCGIRFEEIAGPCRHCGFTIGPEIAEEMARSAAPPGAHSAPLLEGRYRVEGFLARGGMGEVFAGTDEKLRRKVAVKFLAPELCRDAAVVERFLREAQATASLEHPNIVSVYSAGEHEGRPYIVMRYVTGETLAAMIQRTGRLAAYSAIEIAAQICDGLAHIHGHGYVHRDIKPQNVMIEADGRCVILDFGILRQVDSRMTATGVVAGTPAYIAPEQARDPKQADARVDLYALGVTLFEMLTGELPFRATSAVDLLLRHQTEPPPRPSSRLRELPRELDTVVLKLLAKEPARRFQTAADVKQALIALRSEASRATPPSAPVPVVPPPSARSEIRATGVAGESQSEPAGRPPSVAWVAAGLALAVAAAFVTWVALREKAPAPPPPSAVAPAEPQPEAPPSPVAEEKPAAPLLGRLVISAVPADAKVRVNGASLGAAPQALELSPGMHEVEITLAGHKPQHRRIQLAPGQTERVDAILAPLPATLEVVAVGGWAEISIDNEVLGKTQHVSSQLPPGKHVLRVRRPRFRPVLHNVFLAPGEKKRVEVELEKW